MPIGQPLVEDRLFEDFRLVVALGLKKERKNILRHGWDGKYLTQSFVHIGRIRRWAMICITPVVEHWLEREISYPESCTYRPDTMVGYDLYYTSCGALAGTGNICTYWQDMTVDYDLYYTSCGALVGTGNICTYWQDLTVDYDLCYTSYISVSFSGALVGTGNILPRVLYISAGCEGGLIPYGLSARTRKR